MGIFIVLGLKILLFKKYIKCVFLKSYVLLPWYLQHFRATAVFCVCVQACLLLCACNVMSLVLQAGHESSVSFHFLSGLLKPLETDCFSFDLGL